MIERKDKLINKAKVAKVVALDPTLTQDQIAKKAGVGKGTVNRNVRELDQSGLESNIMDRILANDDKIMDLANEITLQKIMDECPKNDDGSVDVKALSLQDIKLIGDMANNSTKRKAIFGKNDTGDKSIQFIIS